MLTIYETATFVEDADALWSADERLALCTWLAANPLAGDVVPGSGGCRKLRWSTPGAGKRGGARVIYFTRLSEGELWLLMAYAKTLQSNIPARLLKAIREELERGLQDKIQG